MSRARWLVPAAVLVAVNALALARVTVNRRGPPDATLTLTERELPVAWVPAASESSGVAVRFRLAHWTPSTDGEGDAGAYEPLPWLGPERLAPLGFDVRLPADGGAAEIFVRRQLARRAWAVLEHEGPAWQAYAKRLAAHLDRLRRGAATARAPDDARRAQLEDGERALRFGSRLFLVDVGPDAAALRAKHPDRERCLIVPVKVDVYLAREQRVASAPARSSVRGNAALLVDEVTVPRRLQRDVLAGRPDAPIYDWRPPERAPRYEVVLRSGARLEPWVEDVRPLAAERR